MDSGREVIVEDARQIDTQDSAAKPDKSPGNDVVAPPAVAGACDDAFSGGKSSAPWGDPMPACVRTVTVASGGDLMAKISGAAAGDCIVVSDGNYSIGSVSAKGTAAAPIVVRAQHRLKAVISSGTLTMGGTYFVFEGFDWTSSGSINFKNCDHCRLTRNRIHLAETGVLDWIVMRESVSYTRIDHNDIGPKPHTGNALSVFGGSTIAQHTHIDHNYLHDFGGGTYPSGGCNQNPGGEAIRMGVGTFAMQSAYIVVEHNLLENCNGDPETISNKSSDNVIRYNTLRHSAGYISLRAGDRVRTCGNFVIGGKQVCGGGIRLCGDDHQIFNNYVEGVDQISLQLHAGDSGHAQVRRAMVVGNTFMGGRGMAIPGDAINTTIAGNIVQNGSGKVITASAAPMGLVLRSNIGWATGTAKLGVSGGPWDSGFAAVDPKLVKQGDVFVLGENSDNAIDHGATGISFLKTDIDGQLREGTPDIGADEYSTTPASYKPLTATDVGPEAP